MSAGDPLERRRIDADAAFHRAAAALHGGEPRQAHGGARHRPALDLRARSSPCLREREYVRIDKKRLVAEDKGLLVIAFLESFFRRYVDYDFTADLEEQLDRDLQPARSTGNRSCAISGATSPPPSARPRSCARPRSSTRSTSSSRRTSSRRAADGADPRACPNCGTGQLSLKLGQVRRLRRLLELSRMPLHPPAHGSGGRGGELRREGSRRPASRRGSGDRLAGDRARRPLRPFIQLGEAREGDDKPKRSSLPKGTSPCVGRPRRALKLLALPREVARHPETGQPILANIGRYGPYVQHGKTYANARPRRRRARDRRQPRHRPDRRQGERRRRQRAGAPTRAARSARTRRAARAVVVKAGRYGPYVTDGSVNATLPRAMAPDAVTLDEAVGLLNARRASGGGKSKRRAPGRAAKGGKSGAAGAKKAASAKKAAAKKKPAAKKAPARKNAAE